MRAVRRFVDGIRGRQGGKKVKIHGTSALVCTAETTETTIPPVSLKSVSEEMQTWAERAGVEVEHRAGVWWHPGDLDQALRQVRDNTSGWVGLQFHGGGYVLGSAVDVRSGGSRIPRGFVEHGICSCVLAVEYSLVNTQDEELNRPFPTQILEALSALHHLVQDVHVPPGRIILIGDSAGGHLALALQRYLLQCGTEPSPGGIILLSPWCDLSVEGQVLHVRRLLGPLPQEELANPYFSPALHAPPPRWPSTLVYYGEAESFKSSITALAAKLAEGGADVTTHVAKEIPERFSHDFLLFVSVERAWPAEVGRCWERLKVWADGLTPA